MMESFFMPFHQLLLPLSHFMAQGGTVLWWLAAVVGLNWLLVIERLIYLFFIFPNKNSAGFRHGLSEMISPRGMPDQSVKVGWGRLTTRFIRI